MATLPVATIINSGDCLVRNCVCKASLPLKIEQICIISKTEADFTTFLTLMIHLRQLSFASNYHPVVSTIMY